MEVVAGITLTLAIFTASLQRFLSSGLFHLIRPAFSSGAVLPIDRLIRAIFESEYQNTVGRDCYRVNLYLEYGGVVFRKPQGLGAFFLQYVFWNPLGGAFALAPISESRASPPRLGVFRADGVYPFTELRSAPTAGYSSRKLAECRLAKRVCFCSPSSHLCLVRRA